MARRGIRERQFTLYFRSPEQKKQMRNLAKLHRLTLSNWILVTLEKSLEEVPTLAETNDKINALRNEIQKLIQEGTKLDKENKILTARLRAKDTAFHDLDAGIVNLFRYGGKEYYTPDDVKDAAALPVSSKAGGGGVIKYKMHALRHTSDPKIRQDILKSIDFTLAQLEAVGFIEKHWKGWKWV